jgi:serine/threonine protein kinase
MKRTRLNDRRLFDYRDLQNTDRDALVMERLSASPFIMDIHGYCGGSVAVEALSKPAEDEILLHGWGMLPSLPPPHNTGMHMIIPPQNNLSSTQKLRMALDMAEGLASLHGYDEGVLVHVDLSPSQWMINSDGRAKLGDFNRALVLNWNRRKDRYCEFHTGQVYGTVRIAG